MKKLFGITLFHFEELANRGYTLDSIFILQLVAEGFNVEEAEGEKGKLMLKQLERKNLLFEGKVTTLGFEILEFCGSKVKNLKVSKVPDEGFDKWWKIFPADNDFIYKGKRFIGTQSKRLKGTECKALFTKYITSGRFTAEDIIRATNYHLELAKEESFKTGDNKLTYIPNTYRYLNEMRFEPFIEKSKTAEPIFITKKGTVDI